MNNERLFIDFLKTFLAMYLGIGIFSFILGGLNALKCVTAFGIIVSLMALVMMPVMIFFIKIRWL
jgi:hypothetical protein